MRGSSTCSAASRVAHWKLLQITEAKLASVSSLPMLSPGYEW